MFTYQCGGCRKLCFSSARLSDLKHPVCPYCGGTIGTGKEAAKDQRETPVRRKQTA